eukprot:SAG22_NODE_12149_length_454_cov_1.512676_2_plen_60_part_01
MIARDSIASDVDLQRSGMSLVDSRMFYFKKCPDEPLSPEMQYVHIIFQVQKCNMYTLFLN